MSKNMIDYFFYKNFFLLDFAIIHAHTVHYLQSAILSWSLQYGYTQHLSSPGIDAPALL